VPSVSEILALPELAVGRPAVVAGASSLDNPVRWVHVAEIPDIAHLLAGGELLLTTRIALPTEDDALARYVASLAEAGVSALVIELGRRFPEPPATLVAAGDRHRLPIVVLAREVRFVQVTEAAHALIIDSQLEELRAGQEIHDAFTDLALEGASASEIVRRAAAMTGLPVLFENLSHQVLICEPGEVEPPALLEAWAACAREMPVARRTQAAEGAGRTWLVTPVGARGETWGRLAALVHERPRSRWYTVMDRAAVAMALNRLVDRDRETLERQSHRSLLADIVGGSRTMRELEARSRALGVPLGGRTLVGCVVVVGAGGRDDALEREARDRELGERLAAAARQAGVGALIGQPQAGRVGALLSLSDARAAPALDQLAAEAHRLLDELGERPALVAVGAPVDSLREARRSLREAEQVAAAIGDGDPLKPYYRLPDVRFRGLLHLLRDDPRLQTFCERELGPLLRHDGQRGGRLLPVLDAYLRCGGNKSRAARLVGLSRPAFYERLDQIGAILGVDLESAESCLSLYAAIVALQESGGLGARREA
jgi:purine catabolism regulator